MFENGLAFAFRQAGHRFGERAVQPVQDRCAHQKGLDRIRLAPDNLFNQIVHNPPVITRKGGCKLVDVAVFPNRQGGGHQSHDPTLGAILQGRHIVIGQAEMHGLVEKRVSFGQGKVEIGNFKLHHLAFGSQARQRNRRIRAGGDDEVQVGRGMFK